MRMRQQLGYPQEMGFLKFPHKCKHTIFTCRPRLCFTGKSQECIRAHTYLGISISTLSKYRPIHDFHHGSTLSQKYVLLSLYALCLKWYTLTLYSKGIPWPEPKCLLTSPFYSNTPMPPSVIYTDYSLKCTLCNINL